MNLCYLDNWNIDNSIQSLVLFTAAASVFLLFQTLREGQKQSRLSNELTQQNLSISQYQIYIEEFKYFQQMLQNLSFKVDSNALPGPEFNKDIKDANGIEYIKPFRAIMRPNFYFLNENETLNDLRANEFRHNIIFPLFQKYSQLHNYLTRIKQDSLLKEEHKKLLYLLIERDILQTYLRICNNEDPLNRKRYNLDLFETSLFQSKMFYSINQFYIDNSLFSLHSLEFYKQTL
jgi:hypothetical protein